MTTLLTTQNGDLYISPQGKVIEIDGKSEAIQRLSNLFYTQRTSEMFLPEYGFDKISITTQPFLGTEDAVYYHVVEALHPDNLYNIGTVTNLVTSVDSEENGGLVANILFSITVDNKSEKINIEIGGL